MTFSTLENKFNSVATQIYNKFSLSEQQLVVVKPNTPATESRIKDDTRLLPFVSTVRDTVLLRKFLSTSRGQLFIANQLLLQTGNTFAEARLYNPASPLIAAIPGIPRIPRQLGLGGGNLLPSLTNPNLDTYRGALQSETVGKLSGNSVLTRIFTQNPVSSVFKALFVKPDPTNYFNDPTKEYYIRPEDNLFYRDKPAGSGRNKYENKILDIEIRKTENTNVTYELRTTNTRTAKTYGPVLFPVQPLSQRGTLKTPVGLTATQKLSSSLDSWKAYATTSGSAGIAPFKILENKLGTNGYFIGNTLDVATLATTTANVAGRGGVTDPYNLEPPSTQRNGDTSTTAPAPPPAPTISPFYANISTQPDQLEQFKNEADTKSDIIKFTFGMVDTRIDPIHFRALLSSLKENVKPEFSEQRYLGRTERFVAYGGAKRTATLAFNIVAFSEMERNQVWKRINFLTGLAYPTGVSTSGFMTPPLFRISVGGIYEDQPCYIDSLNYTFLDESITFDIDAEVPTVVDVDMSIVLLEKRSRYYDSPFYKIVEELV